MPQQQAHPKLLKTLGGGPSCNPNTKKTKVLARLFQRQVAGTRLADASCSNGL